MKQSMSQSSKTRSRTAPTGPVLESLEPRVMLSADLTANAVFAQNNGLTLQARPGAAVTVRMTTRNIGNSRAVANRKLNPNGHSETCLFRVNGTRLIELQEHEYTAIGAGQSLTRNVRITAPRKAGTYYYRAKADALQGGDWHSIVESEEGNNFSRKLKLTVRNATTSGSNTTGTSGTSNVRSAGTLTGSRVFTGSVNASGNRYDYVKFTLRNRRRVTGILKGTNSNVDLRLSRTKTGGVLASSSRSGTSTDQVGRTLSAGTYYFRIAKNGSGRSNYRLTLSTGSPNTSVTAGSSNDRNAGTLTGPRVFNGSVNSSNNRYDWVKFTLRSRRRVKAVLGNTTSDADIHLMRSRSGEILASAPRDGASTDQIVKTLAAGTYYVRISKDGGGQTNYRLTLSTSSPTSGNTSNNTNSTRPDGNDSRGTATDMGTLSSRMRRDGSVNSTNDRYDWYRFTLTNPGKVEATLVLNTTDPYDLDVDLLQQSSGQWVTAGKQWRSGSGGTNWNTEVGQSSLHVLAAGTYFIRVKKVGAGSCRYRMTVEVSPSERDGGETLFGADPITNLGTLPGGLTRTADLDADNNQNDWYKFRLTNTRTVTANTYAEFSSGRVNLVDSSGDVLEHGYANTHTRDAWSRTLSPGTYYIHVQGHVTSTHIQRGWTSYRFELS